jgi:hypothetical protein
MGPVVSEPAALPGDHRARLDEHERVPPAGPGPREPCPEKAVGDLDAGSVASALVDGELVAQGEDLDLECGPRAEAGAESGGERDEDSSHENAGNPVWELPLITP